MLIIESRCTLTLNVKQRGAGIGIIVIGTIQIQKWMDPGMKYQQNIRLALKNVNRSYTKIMFLNSIIIIGLGLIIVALIFIISQIITIKRAVERIYELPHGESLYSIKHHEFNSISLQYVLIAVRAIMRNWIKQSIEQENFESANEWKKAVEEIEKLVKTQINR